MASRLRFHPSPPRTRRAQLRHRALLLTSHQGLCVLSCWKRFRPGSQVPNAVISVQPQPLIEPLPTPPLPADGRHCQVVRASHWTLACEQQGSFAPAALPAFIARMSPSDSLPPSAHFPGGCPVIALTSLPVISHRGGEGLSSCATRPCHHAAANHPAGARAVHPPDTPSSYCLRPHGCGLGLRIFSLSRPPRVYRITAW